MLVTLKDGNNRHAKLDKESGKRPQPHTTIYKQPRNAGRARTYPGTNTLIAYPLSSGHP